MGANVAAPLMTTRNTKLSPMFKKIALLARFLVLGAFTNISKRAQMPCKAPYVVAQRALVVTALRDTGLKNPSPLFSKS